MKIGICGTSPLWQTIAAAGYDYIEGNLTEIALATEQEFNKMLELQQKAGLKIEACNGFFPGDHKLYSDDPEGFEQILQNTEEYVERAFSRGKMLGLALTVLGSSGARTIPEGFDRNKAEEQFLAILKLCGKIGRKYGITVTVEPLNYQETNFINTFAEGKEIALKAGIDNVLAMVDLYHHNKNGEAMDTFEGSEGILAHVHICKDNRYNPGPEDEPVLGPRVAYLKKCGYDGRLSMECGHEPDFETSINRGYPLMKHFKEMRV